MDSILYSSANLYEVEKIINCRYFKNKKYYLIKWLCYPINQSTWEPKSNLKNLKYLIDEFESKYPYTIDINMYNQFCDEVQKNKNLKNKKKINTNSNSEKKLLSKKRNKDIFIDKELDDPYFDKLKAHLYINAKNEHADEIEKDNNDLIVDLSFNTEQSEENLIKLSEKEENENISEKKDKKFKLIMPIVL